MIETKNCLIKNLDRNRNEKIKEKPRKERF